MLRARGFLDPRPIRRFSARNYFAWGLLASEERQQRRTRDLQRRQYFRGSIDLMDVSETEFMKRYRLSKEAFSFLCHELSSNNLLRDTKHVTLEYKLLCALSFYATGSYQHIVGMSKFFSQSAVSVYLEEVTNALNTLANNHIKFPSTSQERETTKEKFYTKFGIPGVLGCVDGCHFHIFKPEKDIEHLFFNRKHFHSFNVLVVCDSDTKITYINPKYGGQAHDSFVWTNSGISSHVETLFNEEQGWLLGDSGYRQRPWLMTPILNAVDGTPEATYNSIHSKTRALIENTFGRLKNRWRCLSKDRTLHYSPAKCAKIITACAVLHNIAIDFKIPIVEPEDNDNDGGNNPFTVEEVFREASSSDDLIRGRAIRALLVRKIYSLHRHHDRRNNLPT